MKVTESRKKTGGSYSSPILFAALLAMLIFGYLLAEHRYGADAQNVQVLQQSNTALQKDKDRLTTRVHQLEAELVIVSKREEQLQTRLSTRRDELRAIKDELGFYRRIMAPETTQEGFLLDGLQIQALTSERHYRGSFVLLQQRQNKAVVKGDLLIEITGSVEGKPASIKAGEEDFLPDGLIKYRFKYFQTVEWAFKLPADFVPETIQFSTSVYQYTTKRGDYARQFDWQEVVEQP